MRWALVELPWRRFHGSRPASVESVIAGEGRRTPLPSRHTRPAGGRNERKHGAFHHASQDCGGIDVPNRQGAARPEQGPGDGRR